MTLTRIISRLAIVCAALVLAAPALASAITSNGTGGGAWSSTATWVGAVVPVSGDSVTIAATDTVTFNVDQSGFAAGLAGLTINGTLQCSTAAGSYYLQMDGTSGHNITFGAAGVFAAGSAGTPLPTTVTFTVNLGGAAKSGSSVISGNGTATLGLYATNPTTLYTTLSAQASAAAGTITLVADVANDTVPWAVGDYIRVDGISQTNSSELFTIKAISSVASVTTITLGLASNSGSADTIGTTKVVGSYVVRVTRNIMVIGYNTTGAVTGFSGSNAYVRCGAQGAGQSKTTPSTSAFLVSNTGATLDGVISGGGATTIFRNYALNATANAVLTGDGGSGAIQSNSGVYKGLVSGCASAVLDDGLLFSGATFTGCATALFQSYNQLNGPTAIKGCTNGVAGGRYAFNGAVVLSNNGSDIKNNTTTTQTEVIGFGASLLSSAQVANYSFLSATGYEQVVIWDYAGTLGDLRAWMYAGRVTTETGTVPPGATRAYQMICERSASAQPVWLDMVTEFVPVGGTVTYSVTVQKDTLAMSETPNIEIVDPNGPILVGATILAGPTAMTDDTGTWHTITASYTNSGAQAKRVRLRVRAAHTSTANVYFTWTQNYTIPAPTVSSGGVQ